MSGLMKNYFRKSDSSGENYIDEIQNYSSVEIVFVRCSLQNDSPAAYCIDVIQNYSHEVVPVHCSCKCDSPAENDPDLPLNCSSGAGVWVRYFAAGVVGSDVAAQYFSEPQLVYFHSLDCCFHFASAVHCEDVQ